MNRRRAYRTPRARALAVFTAVLIGSVILLLSGAGRKTYRAESYRTDITLRPDGTAQVHEEIRVRFEDGPFTFFYRSIPIERRDSVRWLAASDSVQLRQRRRALDVTWRFAPTRDSVRVFTVDYEATGVLAARGDHRALDWNLFPGQRAYKIEDARAHVFLPGSNASAGLLPVRVEAGPGNIQVRSTPGEIDLGPVPLPPQRTIRLRVAFAPEPVPPVAPEWQMRRIRWGQTAPAFVTLAAVLLLAGLFWVYIRSRALRAGTERARSTRAPRLPRRIALVPSPPESLPPALAGALRDGNVVPVHAFAALLGLAARGIVEFDEAPRKSRLFRPKLLLRRVSVSPGSTPGPSGVPEAAAGPMAPHETLVLETAFSRAREPGTVEWAAAQSAVLTAMGRIRAAIEEELTARKDYDPAARDARRRLNRQALMIAIAGILLLGAAIPFVNGFGPAALAPGAAVLLVAAASAIAGALIPPWTAAGYDRARAWKGFAQFLRASARGTAGLDTSRFAEWLPWAAALGAGETWVRAGKKRGVAPPPWLHTLRTGDMGALVAVIAATSAHGGAGGGGAGGGSSGAG